MLQLVLPIALLAAVTAALTFRSRLDRYEGEARVRLNGKARTVIALAAFVGLLPGVGALVLTGIGGPLLYIPTILIATCLPSALVAARLMKSYAESDQ